MQLKQVNRKYNLKKTLLPWTREKVYLEIETFSIANNPQDGLLEWNSVKECSIQH